MLGRLELAVARRTLGPRDLGGVKPKQLLEILLLERGRTVPKERLADLLWGDRLPQRVAATIETYVSVLRRALGGGSGLGRRLIVTDRGMARRFAEMNAELDVRDALGAIQAPCLVICTRDDVWLSPENSRYLAAHIAGARLLELPGVDHDPWVGDSEPILDAVQDFVAAVAFGGPTQKVSQRS
jgi:pimeloyl-ACP methyl ester carboxylesterase